MIGAVIPALVLAVVLVATILLGRVHLRDPPQGNPLLWAAMFDDPRRRRLRGVR